jgi:endonuclease/exonuclease/phosphatase family metal-dependent hydrolase
VLGWAKHGRASARGSAEWLARAVLAALACIAIATLVVSEGAALGDPAAPNGGAAATSDSAAAAKDSRAASRDAYRNQTDLEARATVDRQFPWILSAPALRWPASDVDAHVAGYLSDERAVVGRGPGRRGVVESSVPLRGTTQDGKHAALDLGLVDVGSAALAPKSAAAAVRLPTNSDGQLRFPDQFFGLRLDGARTQAATVSQNKLFFPNVVEDGDLVLEPRPAGAELSVVLRSAGAPSTIPLRFDLSAGQRLRLADGTAEAAPPGSVEVVDGDERRGVIYPASAMDAEGRPVRVTYDLDGDRVLMRADVSGDVAFPVLVDPTIGVYDLNGAGAGAGTTGYTWPNWHPATFLTAAENWPDATTWSYCNNQASNPSKKFYFCQGSLTGSAGAGGPLFIKPNATYNYTLNNYGQWVKESRKDADGASTAYIYRLDASGLYNVGAAQAHLAVGVRTADGSGWETGGVLWGDGSTTSGGDVPAGYAAYRSRANPPEALVGATRYLLVHSPDLAHSGPTPTTAITPGNRAVLRLIMEGGLPGSPLPYAQMGAAATLSSETSAPTLDPAMHSTQPPPAGTWTEGYTDTVSTTARDRGLGMGQVVFSGLTPSVSRADCAAPGSGNAQNKYDACAFNLALPSTTYTAPEGINNYRIAATDLVGNHNVAEDETWQVKVDNSPPSSVSVTGDLATDSNGVVGHTELGVTVTATDAYSGVASVSYTLAASATPSAIIQQGLSPNATCSSSGCGATHGNGFTIDTTSLSDGSYVLTAKATDKLGHSRVTGLTFTVDSNVLTASQALGRLQATRPDVVAASTRVDMSGEIPNPTAANDGDESILRPTLSALGPDGTYASLGSLSDTRVAAQYANGFVVGTEDEGIGIKPLDVGADVTTPVIGSGDTTVYANSQYATDAALRPTGNGIEAFLQLRNAAAPEAFSWQVALAAGQTLTTLPSGNVVIVDPSAPARAQTIEAYPPLLPSPDDTPTDPAERIVDTTPSGAPGTPDTSMTLETPTVTTTDQPPGVPPLVLPAGTGANDTAAQLNRETTAAAAAQAALSQGSAQVVLLAPTAHDAAGLPVPVTTTIAGSTVTFTIRHRSGAYAYPIVVDPEASEAGDSAARSATVHASSSSKVKVMTWNIAGNENLEHDGRHGPSNHKYVNVANVIRNQGAPVVLLQEVCNGHWIDKLHETLNDAHYPMKIWFTPQRGRTRQSKHTCNDDAHSASGNAIATTSSNIHDFGQLIFNPAPGETDIHRVTIAATVGGINGGSVRAYNHHYPVHGVAASERAQQIATVSYYGQQWTHDPSHTSNVLDGGDFNLNSYENDFASMGQHDFTFGAPLSCRSPGSGIGHYTLRGYGNDDCIDLIWFYWSSFTAASSAIVYGMDSGDSDHYPVKAHLDYR